MRHRRGGPARLGGSRAARRVPAQHVLPLPAEEAGGPRGEDARGGRGGPPASGSGRVSPPATDGAGGALGLRSARLRRRSRAWRATSTSCCAWPGNVTGLTTRDGGRRHAAGRLARTARRGGAARSASRSPGWTWAPAPASPASLWRRSCPACGVTLLESASRKCAFLRAAVEAAGVDGRCRVECARSERFAAAGAPGRDAFGVVLARAVAPLPVLVELAAPLLARAACSWPARPGGRCATRARPPPPRPRCAGWRRGRRRRCRARRWTTPCAAVFEKVAPTPERLPRREGMAAKRPLAVAGAGGAPSASIGAPETRGRSSRRSAMRTRSCLEARGAR